MGEYAMYGGHRVKIGTCEDMLYLRADQAGMVRPEKGSVDPRRDLDTIRFRFPFPDEDAIAPGEFEDPDRSIPVWGVTVPPEVKHGSVQFVARVGYLVSLPCPEVTLPAAHGLHVHRNGFGGPVKIVQQAYRAGVLALICQCGGCGARYNLPTLAEVEPIIVACRAEADKRAHAHKVAGRDGEDGAVAWWHTVADRIAAGYTAGAS